MSHDDKSAVSITDGQECQDAEQTADAAKEDSQESGPPFHS